MGCRQGKEEQGREGRIDRDLGGEDQRGKAQIWDFAVLTLGFFCITFFTH